MRQDILDAIEDTQFKVDWGKTRIYNMIRDRGEWVISRQRVWGVPLPVFYAENGDIIMTKETVNHVADLFEQHGSNIWFEKKPKIYYLKALHIQVVQMVNLRKKMTSWMFGLILVHLIEVSLKHVQN